MSMIICPNCGKKTFDEYKCQWCQYTLKEKENQFDNEIYTYLKEEYKKNRNKINTTKIGMEKYNISLQESRNIVNYIADEMYEHENYKSFDEVNNEDKFVAKTFKFSYWNYFKYNFIYKIIYLTILIFLIHLFYICNYNWICLVIIFGVIPISCFIFLLQYNYTYTMQFDVIPGRINYHYRDSYRYVPDGITDSIIKDTFTKHTDYDNYIHTITAVEEKYNHIIIYGQIGRQVIDRGYLVKSKYQDRGTTKTNYIKVPKYFKNNDELIKSLREYIKPIKKK